MTYSLPSLFRDFPRVPRAPTDYFIPGLHRYSPPHLNPLSGRGTPHPSLTHYLLAPSTSGYSPPHLNPLSGRGTPPPPPHSLTVHLGSHPPHLNPSSGHPLRAPHIPPPPTHGYPPPHSPPPPFMASTRAPRAAHAIGQLGHASSPLSSQQPSLIICTGPIHPCSASLHPYHPRQQDPSGRSLSLPQALPYLGTLPDSVPTFSVNNAGHPGLELLAMAALSGRAPGSSGGSAAPVALLQPEQMLLASPGLYNPMAAVSARVVKKVLDLEFVEMAEISADDDLQATGHPGGPARPPIVTISQWLERFSVMVSILATRFPEKAPELFTYQASIIRAERNYEGKQWVAYDRQFWREALARKDLNWSVPSTMRPSRASKGYSKVLGLPAGRPHCNRVPQKSCPASCLGRTNVAIPYSSRACIPTHPGHLQEL